MDILSLEQLIKSRRSIRKWKPDPVPEELALKALELAIWAPNGGNFQNWRFGLITNRSLITKMADAVQAKVDLLMSWPEATTGATGKSGIPAMWSSSSATWRCFHASCPA